MGGRNELSVKFAINYSYDEGFQGEVGGTMTVSAGQGHGLGWHLLDKVGFELNSEG